MKCLSYESSLAESSQFFTIVVVVLGCPKMRLPDCSKPAPGFVRQNPPVDASVREYNQDRGVPGSTQERSPLLVPGR